jgi:hypothetical protein
MNQRQESYGPPSRGVVFTRKNLIEQLIAYFLTPQKVLKYSFVAFRVRR